MWYGNNDGIALFMIYLLRLRLHSFWILLDGKPGTVATRGREEEESRIRMKRVLSRDARRVVLRLVDKRAGLFSSRVV